MDTFISLLIPVILTVGLLIIIFQLKNYLARVIDDYTQVRDRLLETILKLVNHKEQVPSEIITEDKVAKIIEIVLKNNLNYNHGEASQVSKAWASPVLSEYSRSGS